MFQKKYWEKARKRRTPGHKVVRAFVEDKIRFIEKNIGDISNLNILDIGCGNGFFFVLFSNEASYRWVGLFQIHVVHKSMQGQNLWFRIGYAI